MKAGRYYVGDLCYVLGSRWNEVCNITIDDRVCLSGEFKLANDIPFAMYGTAYGDGVYQDNQCREYGVDSGSIGCISIDHVDDLDEAQRLGQIIDFREDFTTSERGGTITIGDVDIYTNEEEEDEDPWYEDDDEEEEYDEDDEE